MALKIGLIGAHGRLGKVISAFAPVVPILRATPRGSLMCDVLIDVSTPEALAENLSANLPIVIGTTGHPHFSLIEEASKRLPIFYAANFSLGASLLLRLAQEIAKYFPADIDIIETHHKTKKDKPSGTALYLANRLPNSTVHSIRSALCCGEHTVIFNTPQEKLTLTHQVHNREAFAQGALAAAHFIAMQPPGLYGMDNLFSSK